MSSHKSFIVVAMACESVSGSNTLNNFDPVKVAKFYAKMENQANRQKRRHGKGRKNNQTVLRNIFEQKPVVMCPSSKQKEAIFLPSIHQKKTKFQLKSTARYLGAQKGVLSERHTMINDNRKRRRNCSHFQLMKNLSEKNGWGRPKQNLQMQNHNDMRRNKSLNRKLTLESLKLPPTPSTAQSDSKRLYRNISYEAPQPTSMKAPCGASDSYSEHISEFNRRQIDQQRKEETQARIRFAKKNAFRKVKTQNQIKSTLKNMARQQFEKQYQKDLVDLTMITDKKKRHCKARRIMNNIKNRRFVVRADSQEQFLEHTQHVRDTKFKKASVLKRKGSETCMMKRVFK